MRVSLRVFVGVAALSLCVLAATATATASPSPSPSRRAQRGDLLSEQSSASVENLIKLDVFRPLPKRPEARNSALLKQQQPNGYSPLMAYSQQPTNAPKALYEAQWGVIDYHSSGGYDAELEDVITNAQLYASMMPAPANQTAWVFDIDETTLSGYEQMKSIGFGYVAKINHDWVMTSSAPAIPQSLAFYRQLVKAGFKIIFLTGRKDDEHDATALNLEKQGYNVYDMLITRTPPEYNLTASDYKNARRTQFVEQMGYDIVGCVGDQFSDMAGPYTGFKVKIPNYIYFLP